MPRLLFVLLAAFAVSACGGEEDSVPVSADEATVGDAVPDSAIVDDAMVIPDPEETVTEEPSADTEADALPPPPPTEDIAPAPPATPLPAPPTEDPITPEPEAGTDVDDASGGVGNGAADGDAPGSDASGSGDGDAPAADG